LGGTLNSGTVLVSPDLEEPHLLVGVIEEVADATGASVARRFGYAFVDSTGQVRPGGPAPYLDCVAAPPSEIVDQARRMPWLADAEDRAISWIVTEQLPEYLAEVRERRGAELARVRELVSQRLSNEHERLVLESTVAAE